MGTSRRYCVYATTLLSLLVLAPLALAQPASAPKLKPVDVIQNIPIYFAQSKQFMLPNPAASDTTAPALTAWACTDQGQTWVKSVTFAAGEFSQSVTAEQGVYWFRFTSDNTQPPGLAKPDLIYIIDAKKPKIALTLSPSPFDPQTGKAHVYRIGDTLQIKWTIDDPYLDDTATTVSTSFAKYPHNLVWTDIKADLPASASMELTIPAQAATQDGVRFRIVARDKAGNLSLAMTPVIHIQTEPAPAPVIASPLPVAPTLPAPSAPSAPIATAPSEPLQPVDPKRFEGLLPETKPDLAKPQITAPARITPDPSGPIRITDLDRKTGPLIAAITDKHPTDPTTAPKPNPSNPSEFLAPIRLPGVVTKPAAPAVPAPVITPPAPVAPAPVAPAPVPVPVDPAPAPPTLTPAAPAAPVTKEPKTPEDVLAEVDAIIAAHKTSTRPASAARTTYRPAAPAVTPTVRPVTKTPSDAPPPPVELRGAPRKTYIPTPAPTAPVRPTYRPAPPVTPPAPYTPPAPKPKPVATPPIVVAPKPVAPAPVVKPVATTPAPAIITPRPRPRPQPTKSIVTHPGAPSEFLKPINIYTKPQPARPTPAPKPVVTPPAPAPKPVAPAPKPVVTPPAPAAKPVVTPPAPAPKPKPVVTLLPVAPTDAAKPVEIVPPKNAVAVRTGQKFDTFPSTPTTAATPKSLPSGPVEIGKVAPATPATPAATPKAKEPEPSFLEGLKSKTPKNTTTTASQNGWPIRGSVLRGGTQQLLNWLPPEARLYKRLVLRISTDNGKRWTTLADHLREGRVTLWTAPAIDADSCRLDILGINPGKRARQLTISEKFHIQTKSTTRTAGPTLAPAPVQNQPRTTPKSSLDYLGPTGTGPVKKDDADKPAEPALVLP